MKTKIITQLICVLVLSMLVVSNAMAQQPKYDRPYNPSPEQMQNNPAFSNYSFRPYTPPNNVNAYGYDIIKNGKPVFRQPVLSYTGGNGKMAFTDKPHTVKAAAFAIGKIKKGMQETLTEEEIRRIASHE